MYTYTMTQEEMELQADAVKTAIIRALITQGKFTEEDADRWCKDHTVLFRKKTMFQTISNLWKNDTENSGFYIVVVAKVS